MPDVFVDTDQDTIPENKDTPPQALNGRTVHKPPHPEKKREIGTLETFCEYPDGITFQHKEKDEEIILFLRQHLITNVPWLVVTVLLIIAPLILLPFFSAAELFPFDLPALAVVLLLLFYYLIVFAYTFVNFLHWFYNIGIVTDKRVVDLDYAQIVHVHVAATKVLQVQDVSYTQTGFFRTLFNFGDVYIQTAGQNPNFEFLRVPKPSRATFIIQKLIGLA